MHNRKTIHVINRYFYPVVAGIEVNIANVYGVMAQRGWSVTVHTSTNTLDRHDVLPQSSMVGGLRVQRYKLHWYGFIPAIDWNSADALSLQNFDIFPHVVILATALARKLAGLRNPVILLAPHGGFTPAWATFPFVQRCIKWFYHRTLGALLINLTADVIRSVSNWERDEMIAYGIRRDLISVIPNGIEQEIVQKGDRGVRKETKKTVKELGNYVIQLARIHPVKNQLSVIKALPRVPNIAFAIAGPVMDQRYDRLLKREIQRLGLSSRVRFLGTVTGSDKYYLLRHARAFVHLSRWESCCNAVQEAINADCPCILSDIRALRELADGQGNEPIFCHPNDTRAIARSILAPASLSPRQAAAARLSWSDVSRRVEILYSTILSAKGRTDAFFGERPAAM